MGACGTAILDFGATPTTNGSVVIAMPGIGAGSCVEVWIAYANSADHTADEHLVETLRVIAGTIVAGVSAVAYGFCDLGYTYGKFNLMWAWN